VGEQEHGQRDGGDTAAGEDVQAVDASSPGFGID
jgi:hypothetical protein